MEATENQNPTPEAPTTQPELPENAATTPATTPEAATAAAPEATTATESPETTESSETTNRHAELPAGEVAELPELSELPELPVVPELSAPRLQNTQGSQNSQPSRLEATKPLLSAAEVEQRVAEAEERGYLRGRNEQIEQLMHSPGVFQRVADSDGGVAAATPADNFADNDSEIMVLSHPRVSIWDK